ncbi:MAG TPA: hypothetical protein VGX70_05865 [Gemmataceae bacterium]|jgi:hypothetical protein|nr:hypothetical protein [Gemmataceae bacterium]
MEISVEISDLPQIHPRLLWRDIVGAAAVVLEEKNRQQRASFDLQLQGLPGFEEDKLRLSISLAGVSPSDRARIVRTYEAHRLVELSAIAITGLGLYHGGGHEIRDIAVRGSMADYLVDDENRLLEIAGRSRQSDFEYTWNQKLERLKNQGITSFYLSVAEFERFTGRLAFLG